MKSVRYYFALPLAWLAIAIDWLIGIVGGEEQVGDTKNEKGNRT